MARVFTTGFETGNSNDFTSTVGSPTVSSAYTRSENYGGGFTSLTSGEKSFVKNFAGSDTLAEYYFRFYIKITAYPSVTTLVWTLVDSTSNIACQLRLDSAGVMGIYDNSGGLVGATTTLSTATWYRVEVDHNGATGKLEWKVDGTVIMTTTTASLANIRDMRIGANMSSGTATTATIAYDDIAINNTSGSTENGYPGAFVAPIGVAARPVRIANRKVGPMALRQKWRQPSWQSFDAGTSAVNATVTQVAASVTATGGTQTVTSVQIASITQSAATVTVSGGTQAVTSVQNVSIAQLAGSVTATGATQAIATVNNVAVTQVAGTVTAAGGTQVITTVNNSSIAQSAATVTATGGTQTIAAGVSTSVTQVGATVTASGGTQAAASTQLASIAQVAGTVTAGGGSQAVDTVNNASVTQVGGVVTATGGSQTVDTIQNSSVTQSAATVTASGGTQVIEAQVSTAVIQLAGTVTATGGVQSVSASSGVSNATITQVAATVTATGGSQVITTSTGPLPPAHSATVIFLADGRLAVRLTNNTYLPL